MEFSEVAAYDMEISNEKSPAAPPPPPPAEPTIRKNLNESAFFLPQLHTDANGNITFSFTLPEALTEWHFMALAHTKDMHVGQLDGRIKTQKDLMVTPGLAALFPPGR